MYDGFIYETTCTKNNMKYRGQHKRSHSDTNDPDDSWYIGSPTNPQFWEDLENYGREAFTREIIQDGPFDSLEHISRTETRRLKEVDAANNPQYYNLSNWGGVRDQTGENNPMNSPEVRAKASESLRGKKRGPFSESHRLNMSNSLLGNQRWLGKHHTEETKAKIAEANRGKILSEDTKRKISEGWDYSTHVTEESRRKQSIARKGKKRPPMIYHVSCIYCGKEFIGTGARSRICSECKEGGSSNG